MIPWNCSAVNNENPMKIILRITKTRIKKNKQNEDENYALFRIPIPNEIIRMQKAIVLKRTQNELYVWKLAKKQQTNNRKRFLSNKIDNTVWIFVPNTRVCVCVYMHTVPFFFFRLWIRKNCVEKENEYEMPGEQKHERGTDKQADVKIKLWMCCRD